MESKGNILHTKLMQPFMASDIIARDRLLEVLDAGCTRPLSLISTPAGYGKSTLVSLWTRQCDCPSGWVSLDNNYNDQ